MSSDYRDTLLHYMHNTSTHYVKLLLLYFIPVPVNSVSRTAVWPAASDAERVSTCFPTAYSENVICTAPLSPEHSEI